MFLGMTVFLLINALYHLGYEREMKWLYYIFVPSLLTIPPVFYLYVKSLALENREVDGRTRFILFLPPLVILLLNFIVFRALTGTEKIDFIQHGFIFSGQEESPVNGAVLVHWAGVGGLLLIQIILAMVSIYKILKLEAELMRQQPRHLAYLQVGWILVLSLCILVFLIAGAVMNLSGPGREMTPAIVFNVFMLVCGGLAGYYGMKQDAHFMQVSTVRSAADPVEAKPGTETSPAAQPARAAETSFMEDTEAKEIIDKLEALMRAEKPYLDPKFTMQDLCDKMQISRRKLTHVINDVMQKNFYGVVNDYRIEEAIRMLGDDQTADYKMDAIAELVGFKSKSSFYACFKKYTGVTPTEYRINHG